MRETGSPEMCEADGGGLRQTVALLADNELGRERERHGEPDSAYLEAFWEIGRDERNHIIVAEESGRVVGLLVGWGAVRVAENRMIQSATDKRRTEARRFYGSHVPRRTKV